MIARWLARGRSIRCCRPRSRSTTGSPTRCGFPERRRRPRGGVVILHGAGSCKESHHDFARGCSWPPGSRRSRSTSAGTAPATARWTAGRSRTWSRWRSCCDRGSAPTARRVALRGSSMGGCFSLLAAGPAGARAVVAICPASTGGLRRGVLAGTLGFDAAPRRSRSSWAARGGRRGRLARCPGAAAARRGRRDVPVDHSRELAARFALPESRLIAVPGGHHRSVQHDEELQAVSVRFLERSLG